jgi:rod shape-determining protein MreC
MDSFLNRYRNITVLLLVIFAQLVLLAYQVKSNRDVRLIRVWAVTAVTPVATVVEGIRRVTVGSLRNYLLLRGAAEENKRLKAELGRVKMENQYLKSELSTADRVRALAAFQSRTPSRTIPSRIIGMGTGAHSRVVFVDRGSSSGVMRGMAVVTPDGIVGKVIGAYPTASQVLLVTDPTFAAGVISQKHRVQGTLKGQGHGTCIVDYVQNEEKVESGEWFYTSGNDGVFPKGFPAGRVTVAREGTTFQQIFVAPSGLQSGLEEVLIVLEGAHQPIPETQSASQEIHLTPPPPPDLSTPPASPAAAQPSSTLATEADRIRERYREIGGAQGHKFGAGAPGSRPPDFNLRPGAAPSQAAKPAGQPPASAGTPGGPQAPGSPPPQTAPPPRIAPPSVPEAAAEP